MVVLDQTDYIAEGFRQLCKSNVYTELPNNPTVKFEREIKDVLATLLKAAKITRLMRRSKP